MNENLNGQMPNLNQQPAVAPTAPVAPVQPVAPVAPQMPQAPVAPVQPAAPVAPQMPQAPVAPVQPVVTPVAPKQPTDKKVIMKWVGFGCGIAIAASTVLPYVSAFGISSNLFDASSFLAVVTILLGVVAALTYFFDKAKRFALVGAGGALLYTLPNIEDLSYVSIGYWLMLLGGIGIIVVAIIENIDEIKSLFGNNKPATPNASVQPVTQAVAPVAPVQPSVPVQPTVSAQPVMPQAPVVEPVVQQAVVCTNCGQPKKNPMDQFCQNCGQRY